MSIFKSTDKEDSQQDLKDDFNLMAPYATYRNRDYSEYEELVKFKATLDAHLEELFKGEIDALNSDTLDALTSDMVNLALSDLARQKANHNDFIANFFTRRVADKNRCENELVQLKQKLEKAENAYSEVNRRYELSKFEKEEKK